MPQALAAVRRRLQFLSLEGKLALIVAVFVTIVAALVLLAIAVPLGGRSARLALDRAEPDVPAAAEGFLRGRAAVELQVRDTGIGIPPDKQKIIFDAFRQATASDERNYGGVGLGLYIANRLVAMMGGTIAVASAPGQGATFVVWLPAVLGAHQRASGRRAGRALREATAESAWPPRPLSRILGDDARQG